jgi:DNA-binding MarR family transcriptional regulator
MSPAAPKHVDDELLAAIQRLGRLMGSRQAAGRIAEAAGAEVSQQGVQILRALHRHGEQPIAALANLAHMDIAAVSRQLRLLEEQDLVRRATAASDGRVALVSLTPTGTRVAKRIRAVGLRHLSDALADWSGGDRADLSRLLSRLVDDLARTDIVPAEARASADRKKRAG